MLIDLLTLLSFCYRIYINWRCCDVAVAQINYLSLNKQDSIEQARGRSHRKVLVQIFMLYDMQLGGFKLFMLCNSKQEETINAKSKKIEIYQKKNLGHK